MERRPPIDLPPDEPSPFDQERIDRVEQEMIGLFDQLPSHGQQQVLKTLIDRLEKDHREDLAEGLVEEYFEEMFPIFAEDAMAYLDKPNADLSGIEPDDYGEIMERMIEECGGNVFYHVLRDELQEMLERKRSGQRPPFGTPNTGPQGPETP